MSFQEICEKLHIENLETITRTSGSQVMLILVLEDGSLTRPKQSGNDWYMFFDITDPSQKGKRAHCKLFIDFYDESLNVKKGEIVVAKFWVRSLNLFLVSQKTNRVS
jgi:hypothetical protein